MSALQLAPFGIAAHLDAQNKKRNALDVCNCLCEVWCVGRDVAKRPSRRLFYTDVQIFQTSDERLNCSAVHNRLRQRRRMPRNGSEAKGRCSLGVSTLRFGDRSDEHW